MRLGEIAFARSGDKGSHANIGVGVHSKRDYDLLCRVLTEEKVMKFFKNLSPKHVRRYLIPNLLAFNFILEGVLDGGGNRSLRTDAQGKALGQALLEIEIEES